MPSYADRVRGAALFGLGVLLAACAADDASVGGVTARDGFVVTEIVSGLDRPTQIDRLPDGRLLVAELHGDEGDGTGRVLAVDDDGAQTVLFDELHKPTGVAVLDGEIWVMEERRLSRGPLTGGALQVQLDQLPFNGRSEGTLTVAPDGRLLYETSGTLDGVDAAPGSATLFALRPGGEPKVVATGFKNAYGRTFGPDGTLWETEVADGTFDGQPAPDELVAVRQGDDFGWPQCVGDRHPVAVYGGTDERCASTPRSRALFSPGATPTSVVVAPWDPSTLLVALWNDGLVVSVPTSGATLESTDDVPGGHRPSPAPAGRR